MGIRVNGVINQRCTPGAGDAPVTEHEGQPRQKAPRQSVHLAAPLFSCASYTVYGKLHASLVLSVKFSLHI